MWQSISLSVWPLVAIWAMITHTYSSCSWTMDTDMVLCSSRDPDVTMALIGNTGHSVQHGPSGMALEHPPRPKQQFKPQESMWLLMATGALAINTDPECYWTMDPDSIYLSDLSSASLCSDRN